MKNISMVRVQSYFPKQLIEELKLLSEEEKVSLAELIRAAVRVFVDKTSKDRGYKNSASTLLKSVSKVGFTGPKNLASQIDKYIYG